jgi:hypothetical protein
VANRQKFGRITQKKEADEKLAQPGKCNKYIEKAEKNRTLLVTVLNV